MIMTTRRTVRFTPTPAAAAGLGDVLKRVVRQHGLARKGVRARMAAAWAKAVGPEIAAHSWVSACRDGQVQVMVDSPALHMELASLRSQEVLAALRREAGDLRVDRVSYRIASAGDGQGG